MKFGGKNAPQSSGMSDNEKIWLAVGITLAVLLALLIIYLVSSTLACEQVLLHTLQTFWLNSWLP